MSRRRAILLFFPLCRTVKATEKIGQRHIAKSTAELYELLYEFLYFFRAKKFSSLLSPFTARNTNPLEIISSDLNSIGFYIPVYNRGLKFQNFSKLSKMTEKNHSLVISKKLSWIVFTPFQTFSWETCLFFNFQNKLLLLPLLFYTNVYSSTNIDSVLWIQEIKRDIIRNLFVSVSFYLIREM